jgi:hypothetical protein
MVQNFSPVFMLSPLPDLMKVSLILMHFFLSTEYIFSMLTCKNCNIDKLMSYILKPSDHELNICVCSS